MVKMMAVVDKHDKFMGFVRCEGKDLAAWKRSAKRKAEALGYKTYGFVINAHGNNE